MPKNALFFFHPASDEKFKAAHPWGYRLIVTVGIVVFPLPLTVYLIFTLYFFPASASGWYLLAIPCLFMIGVGLFSLVAARMGQYLGHKVTIFCIAGGFLIVLWSILLMYNEFPHAVFDQELVEYYFINILFLSIMLINYPFFRSGMQYWFRYHKIKRIGRKDHLKWKDFWWYEDLYRQYHFSFLYHLNRLFVILYPLTFCFNLLFGWIKIVSIPVLILFATISILSVPMNLFSRRMENKQLHGHFFVLFARSENGGLDGIYIDLLAALMPVCLLYAELQMVTRLWGMSFFSLIHSFLS